jgi:predicted  nucleic acid-binding Zn-ribbon protein
LANQNTFEYKMSSEVESLKLRIKTIENDITEVNTKIKKQNTTIDTLTEKLIHCTDKNEQVRLQQLVDGLRLDIGGLRKDRESLETQLFNLKQGTL